MTKELDSFAAKAIPILENAGYLKKNKTLLYALVALFLGIFIGGIFIWAVNNDAFKSDISQSVQVEPNTTIENEYDFQPQNNFTIINNINITGCNFTI